MPLSEVRAGMSCTGLSVVRGTEIASFDVEVLDVIAGDAAGDGARILVRVSGPAIDATGIGPGFSGSPILCDGRNAGAISEGIGEYGNKVALATPIEAILGARPRAAAGCRAGSAAAARSAVARRAADGVRPVVAHAPAAHRRRARAGQHAARHARPARSAATRRRRSCRARRSARVAVDRRRLGRARSAPSPTATATGCSRSATRSTALGRRALFLHDAYVFGVINNPLGVPDLGAMTYKLTSSGRPSARDRRQRHVLGDRRHGRRRAAADPAAGDGARARRRRAA